MKQLAKPIQRLDSRRGFLRSSLGYGGLLSARTLAVGTLPGGMLASSSMTAVQVAGSATQRLPAAKPGPLQALVWRERALLGFGTTLWLRAAHRDSAHLERALDEAVLQLRRIEAAMSLFKPDSELSRLNQNGRLKKPDLYLRELIELSLQISRQSEGAFDISVQPLWTVWQAATQAGRLPGVAELKDAQARVGWQRIRVEPEQISLGQGMTLTLNGIAQGYAADRVRAVLTSHGIEHALLDTGEWSAMAPDFRAANWRLGIANPLATGKLIAALVADGRSVATSSDQHTSFSADHRHHHIFDPSTGYSPTCLASVTVLASSCALADALTKVFFMADRGLQSRDSALANAGDQNRLVQRARALANQWQVDVLLVDKKGDWWGSSGLPVA